MVYSHSPGIISTFQLLWISCDYIFAHKLFLCMPLSESITKLVTCLGTCLLLVCSLCTMNLEDRDCVFHLWSSSTQHRACAYSKQATKACEDKIADHLGTYTVAYRNWELQKKKKNSVHAKDLEQNTPVVTREPKDARLLMAVFLAVDELTHKNTCSPALGNVLVPISK